MKNLHTKCVHFCAETAKIVRLLLKENVQPPLNIIFYVEDCMAASGNISMFFKECAVASEKILTTASEIY